MNTLLHWLRGSLLAAIVIGVIGAASLSAQESLGTLFASVPVPANVTKEEVKEAAILTLAGRQWGLKEKSDGQVVGYLKHRGNEATVTLVLDSTKVDIYCVGYEINKKTGERKKPELPAGWLKNIQGDLVKKLNVITTTK